MSWNWKKSACDDGEVVSEGVEGRAYPKKGVLRRPESLSVS